MIPFSLTSEPLDHALALSVHGELDISTAPLLRTALAEVRQQGSLRCVLDLSACTFIDSTGSRTIALEGEEFELAGSELTLHCPLENRPVRFVVELVGLPEVMTVTPASDATAS